MQTAAPSAALLLSAARVLLYREAPFFGSLVSRLVPIPSSEIDTCGVMADGRLLYNERYLSGLPLQQLAGTLAHEVMHLAFDVFGRRGARDPFLWNCAHDFVVNELVLGSGLELPPGVLHDQRWAGLSAEQVYERLLGEIGPKLRYRTLGGQGTGCADHLHPDNQAWVEGEGPPGSLTAIDWAAAVFEAAEAARRIGRLPAGLELAVGELEHPRLDWRSILARTAYRCMHVASMTWRRPSRRSWAAGVYLPGWTREGREATVALDTSSSISPAELTRFAAEAEGIIREAGGNVRVFCCDAEIATEVSANSIRDVALRGGGGTSFIPVFQRLAELRHTAPTKLLVYFTDLAGTFPAEAPPYPVLWCVPDGLPVEVPPFGSVLNVPFGLSS